MSYSICLKGFSAAESSQISGIMQSHGHRVVRSMEGAQLIVTGPAADRNLFQAAQQRGLKLVSWDEFRTNTLPAADAEAGGAGNAPLALGGVHPLMERGEGSLRLLDLYLTVPCPGPHVKQALVPTADRFQHICFDQPFIDTLRAVCLGASHDLPVALEGETSASKTTAVLWLAHLLGQPVVRLNLNGQTDAGELVGRYVPGNATDELDLATLLDHAEHFSPPTQALLRRVAAENRSLTHLEMLTLAAREQFPAVNWRFQEGSLPKAMRQGWWFLLDEMNLAEPQVLERLNSVLETPRSLMLTEGDGTVFGPKGDVQVHDRFRLFATLNPAEYSGRSVLSPAFRDRWSVWHQAATAGEADYLAMLRFVILGEHPVVTCQGLHYQAEASAPAFARLQELPEVDALMRQLALFQMAVVKASGADGGVPGIGRTRRERYSFTRRTLLNTLTLLDRQIQAGAKPDRRLVRDAVEVFYVNRLRDAADRNAVLSLLRAAGIA